MADTLTIYFKSLGGLSDEVIKTIADTFAPVVLKKDEFFVKEGQVCKKLGFVESGLLMYYKTAADGQEMVSDFAAEGNWVSQYQSFVNQQPSPLFIRAIEHCSVQAISLENLTRLYALLPGFESMAKQLVEKVFMGMINQQLAMQHLRAEERYDKMCALYPAIIQRVPQYYIASYLGIAPPSLSRIRKNRAG